jgi:hypothetical protein
MAIANSPLQIQLSTTHFFNYLHAKVVGSSIATFDVSRPDPSSVLYRAVTIDGAVNTRTVPYSVYNSSHGEELLATMEPANRWRSMLPGAANRDELLRVGHCLFSLLAGLVGGIVGTWFHVRRVRGGSDAEPLPQRPQHRALHPDSRGE